MKTSPITSSRDSRHYPFGLTMAGISSKALNGTAANNKRYNEGTVLENREFSDGSGLELYATYFRTLDPQVGRFLQVDPFSDAVESLSSYTYANNNPIYLNDPFGLIADTTIKPAPICLDCPTGSMAKEKALATINVYSNQKSTNSQSTGYNWYQYFNDHNPGGDFLYELNKWNPLANVINGAKAILTGSDTYGQIQSNFQSGLQLVSFTPVGRINTLISNVSLSAVRKGIAKTLSIPNDIAHIFKAKHKLDLLLPRAGSESNVIRRLYLSTAQSGKLPANGQFEIPVNIYGYNVTVTGAVVDGIPRIGTAYIK